jgi:hypothetical protein
VFAEANLFEPDENRLRIRNAEADLAPLELPEEAYGA